MTPVISKYCVFCDSLLSKDNRSKEHVIPQWLLDYLEIREEKIKPTHFSSEGQTISIRSHTLEGLLAGQVCENCNGGWMSQLEQKAIPILKPLIKAEKSVVELSEAERQILGRWTAKTAYTLNSCSNYLKNIPSNHFKHIRNKADTLPFKVSTFGQQHHGERAFYWFQSAAFNLYGAPGEIEKLINDLKQNSYKISFQFGKLMLLISYLPTDTVYAVLWRGIHVPLLPISGKCGYYDKEEYSWTDSQKALIEFHFGLHAAIIG